MCKNMVGRGRPQMTIWRMRFACWITKATDTYTGYVIPIAFPLQQWLLERTSKLRLRILRVSCLLARGCSYCDVLHIEGK